MNEAADWRFLLGDLLKVLKHTVFLLAGCPRLGP